MNTRPEDLHKTGTLALDRRSFLKGSAGLVVAFAIVDPVAVMAAADVAADSVASPDSGKLYAWLAIHPDNTATLFTGKVESILQAVATGQAPVSGTAVLPKAIETIPFVVRVKLDDEDSARKQPARTTGTAAIFTDHVTISHVIRRVLLRQLAILDYIIPF